jgi:hypothetical protein
MNLYLANSEFIWGVIKSCTIVNHTRLFVNAADGEMIDESAILFFQLFLDFRL